MSKIIVLLADGTGNSAAKLFKTNVWRLYQAVDVRDPPPAGATRQDGELFLFVNDVAIGPFGGPTTKYYDNNQGTAEVRIERLPQ